MTFLTLAAIWAALTSAVMAICHANLCAQAVAKRSTFSRNFQLKLQITGVVNSIFDGYWIQVAELLDGFHDSGRQYTAIQPDLDGSTSFYLDTEGRVTIDENVNDPFFGVRNIGFGGPVFFDSAVPRAADWTKNNEFLTCDGLVRSSQSGNTELVCIVSKKHTQFYVCTGDVPGGPMYEALGRPYVRISDPGDGAIGCSEANLLMIENLNDE